MIDSVLKGTGNSRFLKSAVPAGTSWADALAMLQAGTFPIDLNGINNAGFQQVGTPLNKANLLKDATAAQIGLPPSTTPDGMFQALGNMGELHVWRKTVTTAQEIPAGYTLGDVVTGSFFLGLVNAGNKNRIYTYATSPKVGDDGTVYIDSTNTITLGKYGDSFSTIANTLPGKFVIGTGTDGIDMTEPFTVVFYIPSDAQITDPNNTGYAYVDKYQPVTGYAKTPAGTTTTYPVSTNPNAYQEGDDAKPAGYTLGDVVSGSFKMGESNVSYPYLYNVSSALAVSEDGTISIDLATSNNVRIGFGYSLTVDTLQTAIAGKFVQYVEQSGVSSTMSAPDTVPPFNTRGVIVFIPSDAKVTKSDAQYIVSKYQPVTGYAAIPAGTTIEYLGRLGDKARVQVVSYVGTGTYGESNPCSITADFKIKVAIYLKSEDWYQSSSKWVEIADDLKTRYQQAHGFVYGQVYNAFGKRSSDSKTITWYNTYSNSAQLNVSGEKYTFLVIG